MILAVWDRNTNRIDGSRIIVLDAKTLEQTHCFHLRALVDLTADDEHTIVRLAMSEKYVVANVFLDNNYIGIIWDRDHQDFSINPLRLKLELRTDQMFGTERLSDFVFTLEYYKGELPYYVWKSYLRSNIENDTMWLTLIFQKRTGSWEVAFTEWKLTDGSFVELKRHNLTNAKEVEFIYHAKTGECFFLTLEKGKIELHSLLKGTEPIWQHRKKYVCEPRLEYFDSNFAAVRWHSDFLEIYRIDDGQIELSIELNIWNITKVQISGQRVGVLGYAKVHHKLENYRRDLIVFDLKTGQKILSVQEDNLLLPVGEHFNLSHFIYPTFVIEKERLLMTQFNGDIQAAKFWI